MLILLRETLCQLENRVLFGASIQYDGAVNFSIYSSDAIGCTLVLYKKGEKEPYVEIPIPSEFRVENVYSILIYGLNIEEIEYGYRFDGPFDPENGYLFNKENVVLDSTFLY